MNEDNEYEAGDVFTLTKVINLMPELDPELPYWAISEIKELSIGTQLKVILSAKKNGVMWYRVEVLNNAFKEVKGWINSISLLRK